MENVNDVESASSQSAKLEPQEIEQEQPLEEQKSVENIEVLDDESAQPRYQIRPRLSEKFKPLTAKEVINNVLFDQLSTKTYDAEEAVQWSKNIADTIRERVKAEFQSPHYKYIVNIVLGEQHGAGVKMGTRCIWDAEADSYAYDTFVNDSIFCVATVYAVHFY